MAYRSTPDQVESHEADLTVLRGPWPLRQGKPVTEGVVGELATAVGGARRLVRNVAIALATAIAGGAVGTWAAIRSHYVETGRSLEREATQAKFLRQLDDRLRACEEARGVYLAPRGPSGVGSDP
jgi:hypothetical protein